MTTLSEDANPYDIRIEALRRVKEQAQVNNELQGDADFFYSARAMNMNNTIVNYEKTMR